jgi:hypothetical protein
MRGGSTCLPPRPSFSGTAGFLPDAMCNPPAESNRVSAGRAICEFYPRSSRRSNGAQRRRRIALLMLLRARSSPCSGLNPRSRSLLATRRCGFLTERFVAFFTSFLSPTFLRATFSVSESAAGKESPNALAVEAGGSSAVAAAVLTPNGSATSASQMLSRGSQLSGRFTLG